MAVCTFFGHKNVAANIYMNLLSVIFELIRDYNVDTFYVGNQGEFDMIVRRALQEVKKDFPHIEYYVVLAYPPKDDGEDYSDSLYPEGIELVPKKFAISWRNDWMIKRADYVIGYIDHPFGGAHKFFEKAKKQKKVVENIANYYK